MKAATFKFLATLCAIIAVFSGVVYAFGPWTHVINGTVTENTTFTIYQDAAMTQVWTSGLSTSAGETTSYTETFYIKNDGNVAIIVTPSGTWTSGAGTATWSPTSRTIAKGANSNIVLTLTVTSTGSWSYSISFSSAKA